MSYRQTYSGMWCGALTPQQHARTCGYWYVVQTHGCTAHTAFATRESLQRWADERGLKLPELPAERGVHAWGRIEGSYSDEAHMARGELDALQGADAIQLNNGDYTRAVIVDESGHRVVHYCNPNVRDREVFDYAKTRERIG